MRSAQPDTAFQSESAFEQETATGAGRYTMPDQFGAGDYPTDGTSALKQQVAERLAAHRSRRGRASSAQSSLPIEMPPPVDSSKNRIAAAVAERYAQSQSYRDFLAAEAENAIRQADAAAEVAARSARAVAAAQQQLLAELDQWQAPAPAPVAQFPSPVHPTIVDDPGSGSRTNEPDTLIAEAIHPAYVEETAAAPEANAPVAVQQIQGLTVRLYEDVRPRESYPLQRSDEEGSRSVDTDLDALHEALNEEISFRRAPVFEEVVPAELLPANLIEFPRQLIASRKVRPRLAEGPLRDEEAPESPQLRIFEVEAAQLSTQPAEESAAPEWASIRLGAQTVSEPVPSPETPVSYAQTPLTAPLQLRLMAWMVDGCAIFATFLGFVAAFAGTARQIPTGIPAAIAIAVVLLTLWVVYQLLFFSLGDATPGMKYARIGLCTLSDENPTRAAMRRRILAVLISAAPLGLGFLWAFLDDDNLAWHDRLSRMYQRAY